MKKFANLLSAAMLLVSTQGFAGIINGDFESGLDSWTTTGDVTATTSSISGAKSAYIDSSSESKAISLDALDTFFGLASSSFSSTLSCGGKVCYNGSGFYQTLSFTAGDVLSFDWKAALEGSDSWVDWVALIVEGDVVQLGNGLNTTSHTLYNAEYTFTTTGSARVGFAVGNGGDSCCNSSMTVDNVKVVANESNPVPEPMTVALLGLGLVGIGLSRKKKSA